MWAIGLVVAGILTIVGTIGLVTALRRETFTRRADVDEARARKVFQLRREWLETDFMKGVAESGKPRGLRWVDCDFGSAVEFAQDESNGILRAFVAVTIRFEAIEGGDMEEVEAVGNLRAATAVFEYHEDTWLASPQPIYNLSPNQAILHFKHRPVSID